ncbi:Hsp70 family protein [Plantactinospora sp. S1510]|uniref:Hsp70 family protein n=1 Tax=Plantactinospora alkalitolerans TaxID=2789879 RepID=A0ABS0GYC6_9ACTN|nr:Hsp70 family protein [Plantactinospora alkalitolerans]MBF9130943.1 Hsp70 family protein [Plantactinospora alkalitolerans]
MSGYQLGIDYGSSNTVAVLRWPDGRCRPLLFDGSPLLPSALFLQPDGKLVTGRDAVHSARMDPTRFEPNPKRRVDDGTLLLGARSVPLVEAIAATLNRVADEARRAAGTHPSTVALTYPAGWGAVRRNMLTEAAVQAGLPTPTLVPEPVAAAGYFTAVLGHAVRPDHLLVVYDLGAGTFDVAVVRRTGVGFEVCDVDGLVDFGGLDLDALVVARVADAVQSAHPDLWQRLTAPENPTDQRHFRTLWDDARTAKEMLSRQPNAGLYVPLVDRDVSVGREEFEQSARPQFERVARLTVQVMGRAGVTAENLAGVFLVGGASRVPLAATTVHHATGIAPTVLEQPEIVVAEGVLHAIRALDSNPESPVPESPAPVVAAPMTAWPSAASSGPPASQPEPQISTPPAYVGTPRTASTPAVSRSSTPEFLPSLLWGALAVLVQVIALVGLFVVRPPVLLTLLVTSLAGTVPLRRAVAWRAGPGYEFVRRRPVAGFFGTVLTVISTTVLLYGLSFLGRAFIEDDRDRSADYLVLGPLVSGIGIMLFVGGFALLIRGLRPYPRLMVNAYAIVYQPDRRHRYELPWPDLARVDVVPLGPGLPPALLAVPVPHSQLLRDPAYGNLWRPELHALAIDDLSRLTRTLGRDAPRLAEAVARHRPASAAQPNY